MRRVCVFCGSKTGQRPEYQAGAKHLGELLVRRGLGLVFGGGHIGLMGVLADTVLARGGEAVGVIPLALVERELAHSGLTRLHVVESMHKRKAVMAELSDAFAVLPGAFGTADETFEILTWAQLGMHRKPLGLLNIAGYFNSLLAWIDHCVAEGFLREAYRQELIVTDDPAKLLDKLHKRVAERKGKTS